MAQKELMQRLAEVAGRPEASSQTSGQQQEPEGQQLQDDLVVQPTAATTAVALSPPASSGVRELCGAD